MSIGESLDHSGAGEDRAIDLRHLGVPDETSRPKPWLALLIVAFVVMTAGGLLALTRPSAQPPPADVEPQRRTVLSEVYEVDRKYRSMTGPYSTSELRLGDVDQPELMWITGYEAVMVDAAAEQPMPQDFMCHSNLDVDVQSHHALLGVNSGFSSRLFTLSQGQLSIEFPSGFGIPVLSSEPLELTTQVLNLNHEGEPVGVRHQVDVLYVRDQDLERPLKALFPGSAYGLKLIDGEGGYFGVENGDEATQGPGCLVGENASDHEYDDGLGRTFSGHWVVEPGREVNQTLVTQLMRLPYDTTIHYIAVHLHPFAESLELKDLTTGEVIFKSQAENFEDRIGLARVSSYSSVEGIPVFQDHEYEMTSVYDNTTDEAQDSMAVMYLYLHDREFEDRWKIKQRQLTQGDVLSQRSTGR